MATNVLELRRFDAEYAPGDRHEGITIRVKADVGNAAHALASEVSSFGLRAMLWHDLATMEDMVDADGQPINAGIFGWDDDQLAPFRDVELAIRSPLLRACRVESEPFLINRRAIRSRWKNPYLATIGLEDFELHTAMKSAIVVPIHMPFGQIAAAIFTSADPSRPNLSRHFAQFADSLAELARRFVSGYVQVSRDPRYLPTESVLTLRQIECLRWAALGKTDHEIGIILGCSHAGVRYHLSRACISLGSINRAQSVFRACQLGYLG